MWFFIDFNGFMGAPMTVSPDSLIQKLYRFFSCVSKKSIIDGCQLLSFLVLLTFFLPLSCSVKKKPEAMHGEYAEYLATDNLVQEEQSPVKDIFQEAKVESKERVLLGKNSVFFEFSESKITVPVDLDEYADASMDYEEFFIILDDANVEYDAFLLSEPKRLVVDIFNEAKNKSTSIELDNSKHFSAVRFGAHSDKKRFVFDFKDENQNVGFELSINNSELAIRVSDPKTLEFARIKNITELQNELFIDKSIERENKKLASPDLNNLEDFENEKNEELVLEQAVVENEENLMQVLTEPVQVAKIDNDKIEPKLLPQEMVKTIEEEELAKDIEMADNSSVDEFEQSELLAPNVIKAEKVAEVSEEGNNEQAQIINEIIKDSDGEKVAEQNEGDDELQLVSDSEGKEKQNNKAKVNLLELVKVKPGKNELAIGLDRVRYYSFKQTSPTEYKLTLNNAELPNDSENILAAKDEGQIRLIKPSSKGDDVVIKITAAPETLLMTQSEGSKVMVRSITPEKDIVRAQAKPDLTASEDEGPKIEEPDELELDLATDEDELTEFFTVDQKYTGRLISLDLQDTEIDNALRIIAEVSNLNIISSEEVTGKVSLRLVDVPWDQALDVILKTNGLDKVQEGNVIRIAPVEKLRLEREALRQAKQAEEELEPLKVQYLRVSYAKAAELQPLIETVITERGTVAYDERSNQIIVKDISKGLKNVAKLVEKLDLRTPQVLIETQIVEASRSFVRELGSELGFFYLRTPETGNALGSNFPNSVEIGGTAIDSAGTGQSVSPNFSFFPASNAASAVSALFGSADGTKGLQLRLTQAETEGDVRTISRPSVAVTNNSPAVIKSVTKLRVRLPNGGVTVASGQGAQSQGGGGQATETIEVGIVLNVTAQASPDYYVLMDIDAKSSTLGPLELGVEQIPPEIERSATSSVLVSSGQTFAMGGIYRVSEDDNTVGVPFLKNIPFLGQFFRRTTVDNSDEELIFFITPRIIEGSFDDASMGNQAS